MPQSLLRTIHSLAKYEDQSTPPAPVFLEAWKSFTKAGKPSALTKAADKLIGALITYRQEISIGQRYFQPAFYSWTRRFVRFNWDASNQRMFCSGCFRAKGCHVDRFSSKCPRFQIAWAIEHVTECTNRLIRLANRKGAKTC